MDSSQIPEKERRLLEAEFKSRPDPFTNSQCVFVRGSFNTKRNNTNSNYKGKSAQSILDDTD